MDESYWSLRPPEERPTGNRVTPGSPLTERRLAQAIAAKLAAGYELESQTTTQAVMSMPPRRWLGVTVSGRTKREIIAVDRGGRLTTKSAEERPR